MLQKIFGYKVELVEHSSEYTLVKSDKAVIVGTQIPVRVSGAGGKRTPAVPMVVISCRACEHGGYLVTGRFLVEHPDLSGFAIPPGIGSDSSVRSGTRLNCHLCVISRDLPGFRVMTIDLSEGGLQVEAPSRVALGSSVLLRVEFDTEKLPPLQATATVAWCQKIERGRVRIGLKFKNLDQRSVELIALYRELVQRRESVDIATRTVKDETEFLETESLTSDSAIPTLQVFQWHSIPLFEEAILVGYRRVRDTLHVRMRGGKTGVRIREYSFAGLQLMRDMLDGDPLNNLVVEFRCAEIRPGLFRFQYLDQDKTILIEIEAASCTEQSAQQN